MTITYALRFHSSCADHDICVPIRIWIVKNVCFHWHQQKRISQHKTSQTEMLYFFGFLMITQSMSMKQKKNWILFIFIGPKKKKRNIIQASERDFKYVCHLNRWLHIMTSLCAWFLPLISPRLCGKRCHINDKRLLPCCFLSMLSAIFKLSLSLWCQIEEESDG